MCVVDVTVILVSRMVLKKKKKRETASFSLTEDNWFWTECMLFSLAYYSCTARALSVDPDVVNIILLVEVSASEFF